MTVRSIGACGARMLAGSFSASVGLASTVVPAPGSGLTLGNSYTQKNQTSTVAGAATVNDISGNGTSSYSYSNGWGGSQSVITADGQNTYGFYDSYVFSITGSNLDAITSTINLGSGLGGTHLSHLDAELFRLQGNSSLPSFAPAQSSMVGDSVAVTNFTLTPSVSGTTEVLATNQAVSAGTYVLEVRGLADGASGGTYSGTLNVQAVPVPAALPLVLSGFGLMGAFARRRRRPAIA